MRNLQRKGFTATELMIVVMVIGFLLAVAIPAFLAARSAARARSCQANLTYIWEAKQQWAIEMNESSGAQVDWDDLVGVELYLRHLPECPGGGEYDIGTLDELPLCSIGNESARHPHIIFPLPPGFTAEDE